MRVAERRRGSSGVRKEGVRGDGMVAGGVRKASRRRDETADAWNEGRE